MTMRRFVLVLFALAVPLGPASTRAQQAVPHGQEKPPGEPLSPAEAVKKMTVPEGFTVEIVASEPDLVNPVAMTFDERGRVWVTESLEYPRKSQGPGRDRVKILEDTDGDGKADKFTVFADGLNIPSGIAVGHGGVWVANSPDLLFLRDTDGDGKADTREVVVTGFGRDDTHELPNSLTWGPDGWLYGWNGVFNQSHIVYRGKTHDFTCAIFRVHPKTREFQVFCEGTSNPWGIAWDDEGSAFASACVIDHLWHLTETGYYHRQGGPYPPFTWKIESIVGYKHQKAAYCGIHYYDSDAYPPAYRKQLFMGNIHGNCVNVDALTRNGSTYKGTSKPDFLTANDAWFMPVSQKTGPDGSLYVLDWYDRYHCYQDANRDPAGIDRLKGRLYRVRYKGTPRRAGFDLGKKTDAELVDLLGSGNGFDRETARRLLGERDAPDVDAPLMAVAFDADAPRTKRMNAIWAVVSRGAADAEFLLSLMRQPDAGMRAWGVRAAGNAGRVAPAVREKVVELARDASPDVALQVAVAARKIEGVDAVAVLADVASTCGNDPLIPHIVWQNLYPQLGRKSAAFLSAVERSANPRSPALLAILPRALDVLLSEPKQGSEAASALFARILAAGDVNGSRTAIDALTTRLLAPAVASNDRKRIPTSLREAAERSLKAAPRGPLSDELRVLSAYASEGDPSATLALILVDRSRGDDIRLKALEALRIVAKEPLTLALVDGLLTGAVDAGSPAFRGRVVSALGKFQDPAVGELVLAVYPKLAADVKPRAVELLTQRAAWSLSLLRAVAVGVVSPDAVNLNQVRRLQASGDSKVVSLARARWGVVREGRNPQREQVIDRMRSMLKNAEGDPAAGRAVFQRVCGQCHKLFGEGQEVGPEITLNGRNSYEQLLSNVFDPSLVIGNSYQATTVATVDGRVLTGLLVEDSPQRVVLKTQGAKTETVPRAEVDGLKVSPISLMPEDLEKQLKPAEMADLFAYITLDGPPTDPNAKPIPGAPDLHRRPGTP